MTGAIAYHFHSTGQGKNPTTDIITEPHEIYDLYISRHSHSHTQILARFHCKCMSLKLVRKFVRWIVACLNWNWNRNWNCLRELWKRSGTEWFRQNIKFRLLIWVWNLLINGWKTIWMNYRLAFFSLVLVKTDVIQNLVQNLVINIGLRSLKNLSTEWCGCLDRNSMTVGYHEIYSYANICRSISTSRGKCN